MTSDNGFPYSPSVDAWLLDFDFDGEHTKDLNQLEYDTSEAQNDVNEQLLLSERKQDESSLMRSGSMKRKEQCAKGKSRKKHRRAFLRGESSASQQQPEPKRKDFKEIIEEKSVPKVLKILKDRVNRRRNNDEKAHMEKYMLWLSARNLIQWPLPLQPDLGDILEKIKTIERDNKKAADLYSARTAMEVTDEFKSRLDEVREALENLNEQRGKDFIKTENLEAIFTANEDVNVETLREELSSAFPRLVFGETATNVLTGDHDQGSLETGKQLHSTFSYLENQLYAVDNNKVDILDFDGLKEAVEKTTCGKIPDCLELIANRIESARDKATEFSHKNIQILVCAAIKEMEDVKAENLNWDTLKKWGATLNMAKQQGFQVEFADNLLSKNLYAYVTHLYMNEPKKMGSKIRGG